MPVSAEKPSSVSHRRRSFCFILSLPLLLSKGPHHARESVGRRKSSRLSVALTAPRLRTLHRAEDIGSVLKRGVNVCQRQLVNEVLGPLVTEFVRNFGREGATPIQRRSQAVKFIRHTACRHLQSRPHRRRSPVARTRFKVLISIKRFEAVASTSKFLAKMNKTQDVGRATEGCSAVQSLLSWCRAGRAE